MSRISGRAILILFLVSLVVGFIFVRAPLPAILVPAETLFTVAGFPVTNTLVAAWVSIAFLLLLFRAATSNMQLVPRGVQNFVEFVVEFLYNLVQGVAGERYARSFFPLIATIFFFVITNSWLSLLPGFGTIGLVHEAHGPGGVPFERVGPLAVVMPGAQNVRETAPADDHAVEAAQGEDGDVIGMLVPILRGGNTDLNFTLAMALVAMVFVEFWGIRAQGFGYARKFINLKEGPIYFFVGLLEIISELSRIISFTFRLFGNMFAGEVLLAVIIFLVPWGLVTVFYGLEIFVGLVQAIVFAGLTLVFTTMATQGHGEEHHEAEAHH